MTATNGEHHVPATEREGDDDMDLIEPGWSDVVALGPMAERSENGLSCRSGGQGGSLSAEGEAGEVDDCLGPLLLALRVAQAGGDAR